MTHEESPQRPIESTRDSECRQLTGQRRAMLRLEPLERPSIR